MEPYPPEIEQSMKQFYDRLSEKDRRLYAGIEALKYGHGGRIYIARVLGCSRRTVSKGAKEASQRPGACQCAIPYRFAPVQALEVCRQVFDADKHQYARDSRGQQPAPGKSG